MKGKGILAAVLAALLCLAAACVAGAEGQPKNTLTIYEGPKTMESSKTATVRVNGYELFVYDVMVNHEHIWNANTQPTTTPMAYFDFEGEVLASHLYEIEQVALLAVRDFSFDCGHKVFRRLSDGQSGIEILLEHTGIWSTCAYRINVDVWRTDESHEDACLASRRDAQQEHVGMVGSALTPAFGYLGIDIG